MIATFLVLSLCSPQNPHPSSRFLPPDRTLLLLEVPPPAVLRSRAKQIAQLGAFGVPSMGGFLRFLATGDASLSLFLERGAILGKILESFDAGLTAAVILPEKKTSRSFAGVLIGAAASPKSSKGHGELLKKFLLGEDLAGLESKRSPSIVLEESPLLDTPVLSTWVHTRVPPNAENDDFFYFRSASVMQARRARRSAFLFFSMSNASTMKKDMESGIPILGGVLGLRGRRSGGDVLGPNIQRFPVPPGSFLARLVLRTGAMIQNPEVTSKGDLEEMRRSGFVDLVGVEDLLWAEGGKIRERIEVHEKPDARFLAHLLHEDGKSLADEASAIPGNAIAALRLSLDVDALKSWIEGIQPPGPRWEKEKKQLLDLCKILAGGLGRKRSLWKGKARVVWFFLPPGPGSLFPEPVLMVSAKGGGGEGGLEEIADLFADLFRYSKKQEVAAILKTYGRSAPSIRYFNLPDLFDLSGQLFGGIELKILNGGKISAAAAGGRHYFGNNPRTLRKALKLLGKGESLAKDPAFRERWRGRGAAPIDGFFDFPKMAGSPAVAGSAQVISFFAGMFFGGVGRGMAVGGMNAAGGRVRRKQAKMKLLNVEEILSLLDVETLRVVKSDFGFVIEHDGGTILSPAAWTGFALAMSGASILGELIR